MSSTRRFRSLRIASGACSALAVAILATAGAAAGAELTWDGGAGTLNYLDAANWTEDRVPDLENATDTAVLSGGVAVTYTPGGDWLNNSTFTITGAGTSWTQVEGIAWIKIGRDNGGTPQTGTLNILDGATFNTGTSGRFMAGNGGYAVINVSGGTFNAASSVTLSGINSAIAVTNNGSATIASLSWSQGAISVDSGGVLTVNDGHVLVAEDRSLSLAGDASQINLAGELKPAGGLVQVSGGTLTASLISFDSVDTSLLFSGGRINLTNGTSFDGIFRAGAERYVDFVGDAQGVLFLGGADPSNALNLINDGRVRYMGVLDPSKFIVTEVDGGVEISAVPEPAMLSMLALGGLAMRRRRR